jgi:hypothetical protein
MLQPEMLQQDQFVTLALDTGLAGEESFPLSRILALYARVVLPVSIEAVGKGAAGKVRRKPLPYPYPYPYPCPYPYPYPYPHPYPYPDPYP